MLFQSQQTFGYYVLSQITIFSQFYIIFLKLIDMKLHTAIDAWINGDTFFLFFN